MHCTHAFAVVTVVHCSFANGTAVWLKAWCWLHVLAQQWWKPDVQLWLHQTGKHGPYNRSDDGAVEETAKSCASKDRVQAWLWRAV